MKLQVIQGGRSIHQQFTCLWCGETFSRRFIASDGVMSLEEHWRQNPRCKRNRNTQNPTQSKYHIGCTDPSCTCRGTDGQD